MRVNAKEWLEQVYPLTDDILVNTLQLDSRYVQSKDVFLAIPGVSQHGKDYIEQALKNGAALVLTDSGHYEDARVLVLPQLMQQLPALAARFYQTPAAEMTLVGITGTNGKSSTAFFINQLAQQLKRKAQVIGTLGYGDFNQLTPLANTTPHFVDIQAILAQAKAKQADLVALEVSSHALAQQRLAGIQFNVAVFTNLTRDHLDYHGSMAEYGAAKALLFDSAMCQAAVINVGDEFGHQLANKVNLPCIVYGTPEQCRGFKRFLAYSDVVATPTGFTFIISSKDERHSLRLPLLGEFNIQNVLAAIASMQSLGYDLATLVKAAEQLTAVPGRMEQFVCDNEFTAVIDYAHTPDALEQALVSLKMHSSSHIWCVFGCGGDRDKGKRPLMGQAAEKYADHIIITADNPRSEDALSICQDIAAGISADASYQIEPNRQAAIKLALTTAQPDDIVLIAGKGHETVQIIGQQQLNYDERAYVQQLVTELSV
ncbi:UDP-N-acetylmuramoyl-L-alanyl-D-glutamate--2,6-diaminopimelate ligase [Rheinheimera sp. WS51]|uniref:UDP-N-acetylmuramoyl-L-alanyl-D-glutamate--2, 6-diaminopimelate ligase n=1 Tax=Rheinheimera sp. WS51 TaxID=3425886 RepID=UPI003D8E57C5